MKLPQNKKPTLSIITVVYNDAANFEKTIDSIKSQHFNDYELVVIDGKSSDGTIDIIKKEEKNIQYWISETDLGIYDAMNKGIKAASGEYIHFLNAGDTYSDPYALQDIFIDNKNYDAIYGEINLFDKNDMFLSQIHARDFTLENLKKYGTGTLNHQALFIKKKIVPYFSLSYQIKSELNWYIGILRQNKTITSKHQSRPVINYKQYGTSYAKYWRNMYEWISIIQKEFGFLQNIKNIPIYWQDIMHYRYPVIAKITRYANPFFWLRAFLNLNRKEL